MLHGADLVRIEGIALENFSFDVPNSVDRIVSIEYLGYKIAQF